MTAKDYYDAKRNAPQRVTLPGIYPDMPNATYQEQKAWLSSSMLKKLLPEHYKHLTGTGYALAFGTAFHTRTLGAGEEIVLVDTSSERTKAYTEAAAEAEAAGKVAILASDDERIDAMVQAVRDHDTAAELLFRREGRSEESAFAEVDGVPCRARFDKRIHGVVVDLKSTSAKPGRDAIRKAVVENGYDLSAAHYLAVADALDLDAPAFAFVFVSKTEPHYVTVCDLDEAFLERGRALRALAIERHRAAVDAYEGATGFLTLDCPPWARILETA